MKHIIILALSLITTVQGFSQNTPVNVGSSANNGAGDLLRTAITKLNQNDYNQALSGTASGTDTYTVTIAAPSPGYTTGISAPSAYSSGQVFRITFTNANTGASTLNVNSIGAKSIVKNGSTALSAGDIGAGSIKVLVYDGTNLQCLDCASSGSSYTFTSSDFNESGQTISLDYTNGQSATSGQKGFLTAADWSTFNAKQSALTNSAGLAAALSDESGTGTVAFTSYVDAKIDDGTITDGATTTAPSENAVNDALALKGDAKATVYTKTDNYTLAASDLTDIQAGKLLIFDMSKATALTLTIPTNTTLAIPEQSIIWVRRTGAGTLTLAGADGTVMITGSSGALTDPGLNVMMILRKTGTNTWDLQNGTPGTWTAYIPTFTGFSSDPTSVVARYALIGKTCHVNITMGGDGTSNATTFTITLPFAASSTWTQAQFGLLPTIVNGGATASAPGRINVSAGSNIANLSTTAGGAAWTNSGGKRAFINFTYEIQ